MPTAIHKVKLFAHTFTCSEALCSMLYKGEIKVYAHCYTWSVAICSILYLE